MADNSFYPKALDAFAKAQIDWTTDPLRVYFLGDGYNIDDSDLDEFVDDLADIQASVAVSGASVDDGGRLDHDDLPVDGLDLGETCTRIVVAQDFGDTATDRLVLRFKTNDDGVPIERAGDGAQFVLLVSNGTNRLARL